MTILGADDEGRLRALLDSLGYDLEPSILIGGWATNARVGGEISHDIDLIITDQNLRQRLPERLTEYSENHLHSGGRKARGNADRHATEKGRKDVRSHAAPVAERFTRHATNGDVCRAELRGVDTMWTRPTQIQTGSADQNRTTRDSRTARTPLIFCGRTAHPA